MASFDKFVKDLEQRQQKKLERREQLRKQYDEDLYRKKVDLYSERWQNSIRYSRNNLRGVKK